MTAPRSSSTTEDILAGLAHGVQAQTAETCAKIAEIHLKNPDMPGAEYYNAACREIADKIRRLA